MSSILKQIAIGFGTNIGSSIVVETGKLAVQDGANLVTEFRDEAAIARTVDTLVAELETGEGLLVGYLRFTAPDGSSYASGPLPYGTGARPEDPLIAIGYSRKAQAEYQRSVAERAAPAAGWEEDSSRFYWVAKSPEGQLRLFRVDENKLVLRAYTQMARARGEAALASAGEALNKLADQKRIFDRVENEMREELREKDLEARLVTVRSKMRAAEDLMRRARKDRQDALDRAEEAKKLQTVIDLLKLGGSTASFIDAATADAGYAESSGNRATAEYNTQVEINIEILLDAGTDPGVLPPNPKLPPLFLY
jgi:hypothetical protein